MRKISMLALMAFLFIQLPAQKKKSTAGPAPVPVSTPSFDPNTYFKPLKWRNIGPFRGGRSVTSCGVVGQPAVYYMGTTGGGVWKTSDGGTTWNNVSDGYFKTGSVGAVAVAESDPNVVFAGMGEHAPRGVMTSYGDGVYRSTDAGATWKKMGLEETRHIANIRIHPKNPDIVYVAAQGSLYGPNEDRGVFRSTDGGITWKKILYVDANTGCVDLQLDMTNPRILYAAMWDYGRTPWQIRSGGKGSGLYKSTDGGDTWTKIEKGLPRELGKMGISICRSNSEKIYALVESDTEKEQGGLFVSQNSGKSWERVSKDHRLVQRAWYYIEIFADPLDENTVYVLNSPGLKSADGGKTWSRISGTHGDYHQLWINPNDSKNMIVSNDGGAAITLNGGQTWSTQNNQPTAQFYRVNADNEFPYHLYGGQQDNSSVMIQSRNPTGFSIGEKNWESSAGGESAFLAFNPDNPRYVFGGSYQGTIEVLDRKTHEGKPIMAAPIQYQSLQPKDMKYRFNWNAPIIWSRHEPSAYYHGGNVLLKTTDLGKTWQEVSPDLTRNDKSKQGVSGVPYTNEGAGGENYATLSYIAESPNEKGVILTGSDDGFVFLTRDDCKTWTNVTPTGLPECLINSIEISPHDNGTAYIATTRYKFNDLTPAIYKTTDYGKSWKKISEGIPYGAFTRVVREDDSRRDLLYAGTETGFYISYDGGTHWTQMQLNLPVTPITDLKVHQGNLLAATMGRAFWILDDLNVLRQADTKNSGTAFRVYQPSDLIRVFAGSPLDAILPADDDDDDNIGSPTSGTNPASGAVIYYELPAVDSGEIIRLEIKDASGKPVRQFTSKTDKKSVSFPGGPPADPELPAKKGLNRFVWDLRYPTMIAVPNVFIEGSYRGRKVAPGQYTATIKTGKEEKSVSFRVLPFPGLQATNDEYASQQELLSSIENSVDSIHDVVNRMRSVKKQLKDLMDILGSQDKWKQVKTRGNEIIQKINTWEEKLVQPKSQSNDDVINFVNKLSADYIFLHGELDVNTPYVTNPEKERYAELEKIWKPLREEYQQLRDGEIASFNQLCRSMGIENILVPAD